MALNDKTINFDINKRNIFNLTAKQYDTTGARSFTFRLLKDSITFDLTGLSVKVGGKKPDEKDIFNDCIIKDAKKGIVELELTTQMQVVAGTLNLELIILKGETRLSTIPFEVQVIKSAIDLENVVNSDEFGVLNSAINKANEYSEKLKQGTEKIELQYADKLNEVNSKLNFPTTVSSQGRKSKAMVSFIDDDCRKEAYTKLRPVILEKNIPFGLACPPDAIGHQEYMTWEEVKQMKAEGCEILCHGNTQANFDTFAEDGLNVELQNAIRNFEEQGIYDVTGVAYPQGKENEMVRRVCAKYFKMGYGYIPRQNYKPLRHFDIQRAWFGNGTEEWAQKASGSPYPLNTMEYYKWVVDKCWHDGLWLVFCCHAWFDGFNAKQLSELVDYIRAKGMEIVLPSEGFKRNSNPLHIGDSGIEQPSINPNYVIIDSEGNVWSNGQTDIKTINTVISKKDFYNATLPPNSFRWNLGQQIICAISGKEATKTDYPENSPGTLITHVETVTKLSSGYDYDYAYMWQEYINYNGRTFRRNVKPDGNSWNDWSCLTTNYGKLPKAIMKLTEFPVGESFYFIDGTNWDDMPLQQSGVLKTIRMGKEDWYYSYSYQEFTATASNRTYKRTLRDINTWTEWKEM